MTKSTKELYQELETLRKEAKKLGDNISIIYKQWEESAKKDNQNKATDIEWLINNPNTPGQHEGMRTWMQKNVGGDYKGVSASGYYPSTNQQSFDLTLGHEDERNNLFDNNIKKFFEKVLPLLKPTQDNLVVFSYASGQYSGIKQLAWDTGKKEWVTFETRYGDDSSFKIWDSLDDALDYAWKAALTVED